jgi:hypothetical protein
LHRLPFVHFNPYPTSNLGLETSFDHDPLELPWILPFPPGTSKWNKIEHRMFSHITENWRGRPLISHEVIVNLIDNTTTATGLHIKAELDLNRYPTGLKITDQQMKNLNLHPADFHGEDWNYNSY